MHVKTTDKQETDDKIMLFFVFLIGLNNESAGKIGTSRCMALEE